MIKGTGAFIATPALAAILSGCSQNKENQDQPEHQTTQVNQTMKIQYLEIVTPDVEAAVALHSQINGVSFSAPEPNLGGARTAELDGGGWLGIRAPLRETEEPVVRPYFLVDDIDSAVASAASSGAEIAMNPMEIPGYGKFAIFISGGIETGLWQL